jgi:hypothetical protein
LFSHLAYYLISVYVGHDTVGEYISI